MTSCEICSIHGISTAATTTTPRLIADGRGGLVCSATETLDACDECARQGDLYPTARTYYAVCDAGGPISHRLAASTLQEARDEIEAAAEEYDDTSASREWIDDGESDAEDDLEIAGDGMSYAEFAAAMQRAGAILDEQHTSPDDPWDIWSIPDDHDVAPVQRCECGQATGVRCDQIVPAADLITIEWMPPYLRESHQAAGNSGCYPGNGALRLRVTSDCGEMVALDGEDD